MKTKFNELHSVINGRSSLTDILVVLVTKKRLLKLNIPESILNIPVRGLTAIDDIEKTVSEGMACPEVVVFPLLYREIVMNRVGK